MNNNKYKFLLVCGEASGDMHASNLIYELKKKNPNFEFYGIGGDRCSQAGMNILYHIKNLSFLGITEVLKNLSVVFNAQKEVINFVKKENIKNAILIDYPGFNLRLAKKLKKIRVRIIYYISPQIWAWGENRIKQIKKNVDLMLCILPFEEEFYRKYNVRAEYVGHPLLDNIGKYNFEERNRFFEAYNLDINKEILLLLPGSRKHEVKLLLKEMLKAAKIIATKRNIQVAVSLSENIDEAEVNCFKDIIDYRIIKNKTYDLMKYAAAGIVKSGTSTLEAALLGLPFIVVYKASFLTYFIAKKVVKVQYLSLANLIYGDKVVEEYLQNDCVAEKIANGCEKLFIAEYKLDLIKKFERIKEKLGTSGASERAAIKICDFLLNTKL